MADRDAISERGRSLEEDYFRKKDRELVEKIRRNAAAAQARRDLGEKTGSHDETLLQELLDLGFTPDTVSLLPLLPVVQLAWAEGGITPPERELIVQLARSRAIEPGSAADTQLTAWMTTRPTDAVFDRARRLIRAMLESGAAPSVGFDGANLVDYCEQIAAASGGLFGIGRISAEERKLLESIAADMGGRRS